MAEVKQKIVLEVKKEDRIYGFECAASGSLGEIFDVLQEMKAFVVQKLNEAQQAEKPADVKSEEKSAEELPKE